jgi:hypothetical protein
MMHFLLPGAIPCYNRFVIFLKERKTMNRQKLAILILLTAIVPFVIYYAVIMWRVYSANRVLQKNAGSIRAGV